MLFSVFNQILKMKDGCIEMRAGSLIYTIHRLGTMYHTRLCFRAYESARRKKLSRFGLSLCTICSFCLHRDKKTLEQTPELICLFPRKKYIARGMKYGKKSPSLKPSLRTQGTTQQSYTALYPPREPPPCIVFITLRIQSLSRYGISRIVSECGTRSQPRAE